MSNCSACVLLPSFCCYPPFMLTPFLPWTSVERCCYAVLWCIRSFGRTHTALFVMPHALECSRVYCWHFLFVFSPLHTEFESPLISLVRYRGFGRSSQRGWGDQLNIYGSTFIQMFGNGESLWPENWHELFVHNMQQGTWRASLQYVSTWMCFVVAVLADDVIVMDMFVGCGLLESYWYHPTDQKRGSLCGPSSPPPQKKYIRNSHQNFRSKQITIEIGQSEAQLQIAWLPI